MVRAGRRFGKTTGLAIRALTDFTDACKDVEQGGGGIGGHILYAGPTADQTDAFWQEIEMALGPGVESGLLRRNSTKRLIELRADPYVRIRAKTAFSANGLRGDFADLLILDEYQIMNEDVWEKVGSPMLIDNDGTAIFLYTPPSVGKRDRSQAQDKLHAAKMFAEKQKDPEWLTMHFTSLENPHASKEGLDRIVADMTALAYRMEIEAEDIFEAPGSLWKRSMFGRDQRRATRFSSAGCCRCRSDWYAVGRRVRYNRGCRGA